MSFKSKLAAIAIAIVAIPFFAPTAQATEKDVVVIVVDGIGWHDWVDSAGINAQRMLEHSAIALSNNRSAQEFDKDSVYLTIGAGARSGVSGPASGTAGLAYSNGEKIDDVEAGAVFERYTGIKPPPGSAFHTAIPAIIEQNSKFDYGSIPGLLGQTMKEQGRKVAILGNADGDMPDHREAVLIGMDSSGIIPWAKLDGTLTKKDELAPYGKVIDTEELSSLLSEALEAADLTIIDFGDTARVERAKALLLPEILESRRQESIKHLDPIIGALLDKGREQQLLLIVVTPNASNLDAKEGRRLTPAIIYRPEAQAGSSWIYSASTRRQGIILGTDIAPTILDYLDVAIPPEMSGQPLRIGSESKSVNELLSLEREISETSLARPVVLTAYITALIIFLITILLLVFFGWRVKPRTTNMIRYIIVWLMAVPAVLVLLGAFGQTKILNIFLMGIPLSLTVALFVWRWSRRDLKGPALILGATAAIIIIDTITGQVFSQGSVLGYDPIIGARFYGIGNELMGMLVGSVLVVSAITLELWPDKSKQLFWGIFTLLVASAFIIGHPSLGANLDGTTTAVVAFTIAALKFRHYRLTPGKIAAVLGLSAIAMVILFSWDLLLAKESSHLGHAASYLRAGDYEALLLIIKRKAAINYRLLQWTVWSRVFILSLAVYAILFMRPIGLMREFVKKHLILSEGIVSAVIGSIIAMIANDSGVVSGATTIIFAVLTQLYVIIDTYQPENMVDQEAS